MICIMDQRVNGYRWVLTVLALFRAMAGSPWGDQPYGRSEDLARLPDGHPGFTVMPASETGVAFTNRIPTERSLTNHIFLNGSGVALGDVDGDGRCDVFLAGSAGGSALYLNLGDWHFTNVTATAFDSASGGNRLLSGLDATGAVLADVNGDGHLDLLVNGVGQGTHLFHNDGHGHFSEVTQASGLNSTSGAMSMALADIDGDGDLDLYVANYRSTTVRDDFRQNIEVKSVDGHPEVVSVNGRSVTEPDLVGRFSVDASGTLTENGEADVLYLNDGHGKFSPVSFTSGAFRDERGVPLVSPPYDWGLSVMFRDFNGDGLPDIYVCNDLNSPDRVWLNQGHGQFRALPRTAIRKTSWFSMGIDFGDLNRDGIDDFIVTDMLSRDPVRRQIDSVRKGDELSLFSGSEARPQTPRNTVFLGRGDGTYAEVAWYAGLAASDWSWSPVLLDVDLDGYEDVLITTGFDRDVQDADVADEIEAVRQREKLGDAASRALRKRFPHLALPNLAFRNDGKLGFLEASHDWNFDQVGVSQGAALADLDGDGDLDMVINRQNDAPLFLRNNVTGGRLAVRLRGLPPNTQGIGARIEVEGGPVAQSQEIVAGGRYLSGDNPERVFAAGSVNASLRVRVTWRDGRRTDWIPAKPNQRLEIVEDSRTPLGSRTKAAPLPLFSDVSSRLNHRHTEAPFDDFDHQPLLPRRLSQLGPAVAWGDLNGDGWDDLIVGSGRGGRLGVYLNDGHGEFGTSAMSVFQTPAVLDSAGLLIVPRATQAPLVLVASSSYESPQGKAGVRVFDLAQGVQRIGGISLAGAIGPLAMADVDGDGQLDLFVGGRVMPGRYPEPLSSGILRGKDGFFVPDTNNNPAFVRVGMVTGAVFTDFDDDGNPDLVLATEWGPLKFFRNQQGLLHAEDLPLVWEGPGSHPTRLSEMTGLWAGVTAADLDGDGRLDWVVGNWGRNSPYNQGGDRGNLVEYGDWQSRGAVDLVEGYVDSITGRDLPYITRDALAEVWPGVKDRFTTRKAFGSASVGEILEEVRSKMQRITINTLESVVLLNRGDHLLVRPLPMEAQWSSVQGVIVADFDGDGVEDLFLSQNDFAVGSEKERLDAGEGLLLRGGGHAEFTVLSGLASGIHIPGSQRGAATADFDGDGRPDLVVTQNSESTCLFRNVGGRPGLRVRLNGPPGNPSGVGVLLRVGYGQGKWGPVREVHAGAGYWSQDSPVTMLGLASPPVEVSVRWPGRKALTIPVANASHELKVTYTLPGVMAP